MKNDNLKILINEYLDNVVEQMPNTAINSFFNKFKVGSWFINNYRYCGLELEYAHWVGIRHKYNLTEKQLSWKKYIKLRYCLDSLVDRRIK